MPRNPKLKPKIIVAVVVTANVPTETGLIYNEECIDEIVRLFNSKKLTDSLLGWIARSHYSHSEWLEITSDKSKASHIVKTMYTRQENGKNKQLIAEIQPLGTKDGELLTSAIENKKALSLGLRCLGHFVDKGTTVVSKDGIQLLGLDVLD